MRRCGVALCALAPHPPLLVPAVGSRDLGAVRATVDAMGRLGAAVKEAAPDVIVIVSPHAPLFEDVIAILADDPLSGDFSDFMAPEAAYSFRNDLDLARKISSHARKMGIETALLDSGSKRAYRVQAELDHGVLVPMHYLAEAGVDAPLVVMGMALLPREKLYSFGRAIAEAARDLGRRAAVIASGDLSHRLARGAPAGHDPAGRQFDERLVELMRAGDVEGVLGLDSWLVEAAGECGYRSLLMALGSLDEYAFEPEVLSYEGPFGVGYAVAIFRPVGPGEGGGSLEKLCDARQRRPKGACEIESEGGIESKRESPLVRLARAAVEEYVRRGRIIDPPDEVPEEMRGRAGVFCSIKKGGQLRGCIGTIQPTTVNIAREIIRNAIAAATEDPRFPPVDADELDALRYSVDVLMPPERVLGVEALDPKVYGVIVRKGARSGLLLPDLEGIDDGDQQVAIATRKAGIAPEEDVELWRFEVKRYK